VDLLQPLVVDGRFVNPELARRSVRGAEAGEKPGFKAFWKWHRERAKLPKTFHVERVEASPARLPPAPERGVRATWVGHSSVVLQIDGRTYLTDPVWSARIGGVVKRLTPPGVAWDALPPIDGVLQSHNHYDHLDAGTVERLPRDTPVYCTTGVGEWYRKRRFREVVERSWWETARAGGDTITCVPAQHFSGRTIWDRDRTLWGGWVVEGSKGTRVYFAGDTGWCSAFAQVGERFGRFDLALIPVGAYAPRWFMAPVHVDPPEAGRAFLDARADALLPIHWGTFRLADEGIDEPPRVLRQWWDEQGLARERLLVPRLGESFEIGTSAPDVGAASATLQPQ
jgi:L-ascorbate metabolism protein UlaG (beta-lactamase superfamily)